MDIQERIVVVIELVNKSFDKDMNSLKKSFNNVKRNVAGFNNTMKDSLSVFKSSTGEFQAMKTKGGQLAHGIRKWSHGMRGFRMEMLGLMFAGMALTNTIKGLFQPVMDAFGVMDLWSTLLLVTFLPIMNLLMPLFLSLFNFFMGLPEPVKMVIGVLAIFAFILGMVAVVMGTVALAMGSIILVGAPLFATIAIIVGVIILLVLAAALIIKNWDKITAFFRNLWDGIKNIFMAVVNWIVGVFEKPIQAIMDKFNAFKTFFSTLFDGIKNTFIGFINSVLTGIEKMINNAISGLNRLISLLNKIPGVNIKSIGSVTLPRIPMLADGGIVTKPTLAMVGEAGPEAVVPLNGKNNFGGGVVINQTINVSGFNKEDIAKLIRDANNKLMSDVQRLVGA
jgi:phage-related protein